MSRSIDKIQLIAPAIFGVVIQRDTVSLDGDSPLALDIQTVENLFFHFAVSQTATALDKTIRQGGFAMIDVRDDGEISDVA